MPSSLSDTEQLAALQHYAAPEQTNTSADALTASASAATDVFALGMLTYHMVVGKDAFPAKEDALGRRWQVNFLTNCCAASTSMKR